MKTFISIIAASFFAGHALAACQSYWAGTAPFCEGSCPPTHTAMQSSDCGDGSCCWSGSKVWCQCKDPVSVCQNFWSGTAPFCNGECPAGFRATGSSKTGGGGTCVTGTKVLCSKDGCAPACVPGQINFSCLFGVIGICDAGCGKYVCGGCVSGGQGFKEPGTTDTLGSSQSSFQHFNKTQLRDFVSSRFLDKHLGLNLGSTSEPQLREIVGKH